jgi:hypothetical protein
MLSKQTNLIGRVQNKYLNFKVKLKKISDQLHGKMKANKTEKFEMLKTIN